ncbi:hypothetical protein OUZ56_027922 [Daphnia magna]|uniref:Uncharacterized protein n=1 Tax=Daphnia magna TaxID=35525 RepID=A0ABR0B2C0_9CRUS|nr:hypothetical protein OUZ56_027922 [Daphnia magna]
MTSQLTSRLALTGQPSRRECGLRVGLMGNSDNWCLSRIEKRIHDRLPPPPLPRPPPTHIFRIWIGSIFLFVRN